MKTLEELVKELGLKPHLIEKSQGRNGNYIHIFDDNTYISLNEDLSVIYGSANYTLKVIEVKPE